MMGRSFNLMVRLAAMGGIRDTQCGFKLFTRRAAHDLFARAVVDGFAFDVEVLWLARGRYRVAEVPVVLALDVAGLQSVVQRSPDLQALAPSTTPLAVSDPFAVLRLWLDRPMRADRVAFAGTTGVGLLDNISVYERFQSESARWATQHRGSVVELHAYAVPPTLSETEVRADLIAGLHTFYPEARDAQIAHERMLLRRDCPAFEPGGHASRPGVATAMPGVALAGDGIRTDMPCALMERAAITGFLAANSLLSAYGVAAEPIRCVPSRGLLAPPGFLTAARVPVAAQAAGAQELAC
jgi:isorenieratene synthase